jgi:hypothetical protein
MRIKIGIIIFTLLVPAMILAQTPDGKIEPGEYENLFETKAGDFSLHWTIGVDRVYFAMRARTDGWVAIGINPVKAMGGADMIFGYVTPGGKVEVFDTFATGPYGPHPLDEAIGGTFDILEFGGSEEGGFTLIECARIRDTGDSRDKPIRGDGSDVFIWAYGAADDIGVIHTLRGGFTLRGDAVGTGRPGVNLLLVHIVLMSLSFVLMSIALLLARYLRKVRGWLNLHRILGVCGACLGGIGIGVAAVMVQLTTGMHLRVIHSFAGLASLTVLAAAPIVGQTIFTAKRKEMKIFLRMWHKWIGRIAILIMLGTIVLGLFQAGVLRL